VPRILEIGFGNGSFMGWARSNNFEVFGTEVQPELCNRALEAGFSVVNNISEFQNNSLDCIVAIDVFEHIEYEKLKELCCSAYNVLKPGGYLIARFPNGDSPFSMPIQNADATHVHALGAGMVFELTRLSGLKIEELRAPVEIPLSLKSKFALPFKRMLRALFSAYVKLAFLGGVTPSTFNLNYLLIAKK